MKAKLSKQKKSLLRVIIASVVFAALFITEHTVKPEWYVSLPLFLALYLFIGWDIAYKAFKGVIGGQMMDENLLMFIATVGAFIVGEYPEAAAVMLFYQIGELFQSYAVGKSRSSIAALMDIRPDTATVVRNGEERMVAPEEVETGEIIVVRPGEKIPVDGTVADGVSALNTVALTGESAPQDVAPGSVVLSGAINESGALKIRCDKAYCDSTVARILDLVENASSKKAKAESFITKFAAVYTPVVVILAVLLALIPPLIIGWNDGSVWVDWVYRALTFLVVSCPCALVISVPLSFFGAIGGASKAGILIKGGNCLEILEKTDTVLMDKTGTITKGSFSVKAVIPADRRDEILAAAAVAESRSTHPIARSIESACRADNTGWMITELAGLGVSAEKDGSVILAGNKRLMEEAGIKAERPSEPGTVVYVARDGKYLGSIVIGDEIKEDSAAAIASLKAMKINTVMLTGDNEAAAAAVAEAAGIDEYKAGLLPADKVAETEKYLGRRNKTAFVGDGINDAPVLMRADLGVAMGGIGSDSAIEAADIVLMHDSLSALPKAKRIAGKTMRIVRENIIFALAVKIAVLLLSAVGFADMWLAIFADVGVTVIAVLNSMRMLSVEKTEDRSLLRSNLQI